MSIVSYQDMCSATARASGLCGTWKGLYAPEYIAADHADVCWIARRGLSVQYITRSGERAYIVLRVKVLVIGLIQLRNFSRSTSRNFIIQLHLNISVRSRFSPLFLLLFYFQTPFLALYVLKVNTGRQGHLGLATRGDIPAWLYFTSSTGHWGGNQPQPKTLERDVNIAGQIECIEGTLARDVNIAGRFLSL